MKFPPPRLDAEARISSSLSADLSGVVFPYLIN